MDGVDPYKLLDVPTHFTLEQLQYQYKQKVMKYYPGGTQAQDVKNSPMFQILTGCYKLLLNKLPPQSPAYPQSSLELASTMRHAKSTPNGFRTPPETPYRSATPVATHSNPADKRFTIERFNQMFEQHRVSDVTDRGYQQWMADPNSIHTEDMRKQLNRYKEPQPMDLALGLVRKTGTDFYQLGVDKVDDFSGENVDKRSLNYMDYRVAHTAKNIIDPNEVRQRREYKNVQELEVDRAKPVVFSPQEEQELARQQKMEALMEKKRLRKLARYDERASEHYDRTHNLFAPSSSN